MGKNNRTKRKHQAAKLKIALGGKKDQRRRDAVAATKIKRPLEAK